MNKKATVIISVYKNTRALAAVLRSLEKQTEQCFEVIISEDGESTEMKQFVEQYMSSRQSKWDMLHLTQEDICWRKNRALNCAIEAADTDWLIFIDGDCVLHPKFVETHIRYSAEGVVLAGKRVKLNPQLSERLMNGETLHLLPYLFCKRGCTLVEEGFYLPLAHYWRRHVRHLTGSNMSMSKKDIKAINGFDENYILPAIGEDFDIEWRLPANGCKIVSVRNLAVQYHLYHKENWVDDSINMQYFNQIKAANQIVCKNGIQKL
ncbi:MAG: glycosyltransferase [Paludibacteraceae bacterium]|nr:glycosyltransferase [Paludibacteraceae bacterium]